MSRRIVIASAAGVFVGLAVILSTVYFLEVLWPQDNLSLAGGSSGNAWRMVILLCHLVGGVLGGGIATLTARMQSLYVATLVALGLFVVGAVQIIGDWGHMPRFFWNLLLLFVAVAGVFAGWRLATLFKQRSE